MSAGTRGLAPAARRVSGLSGPSKRAIKCRRYSEYSVCGHDKLCDHTLRMWMWMGEDSAVQTSDQEELVKINLLWHVCTLAWC